MKQAIIRVWVCCGKYGWDLPWPAWHAAGVYAQPPDDLHAPYVFVYSRKGQPDETTARSVDPTLSPILPEQMLGVVDADQYLTGDGKWNDVNWDGVLESVRAVHKHVAEKRQVPPAVKGTRA